MGNDMIPLLWEGATSNAPSFGSPLSNGPFNEQVWKTYWSNELADAFFGGNTVSGYDDPIEVVDETGIYAELMPRAPATITSFSKAEGILGSVTIKVFVSKDLKKLIRARLAVKPKDDELLVFLENNGSSNQMIINAGDTAKANIGTVLSNQYIKDYLQGKEFNITQEQLAAIIKSCKSKSMFLTLLENTIGLMSDIAAWSIEKMADLFFWIGEKIKHLKIADSTWNAKPQNDLTEWLDNKHGTVDQLFNDFFKGHGFLNPIPEGIRKLLETAPPNKFKHAIGTVKEFVLQKLKEGNPADMLFAMACGVINGVVDMVAGIFDLIGLFLKLVSVTIKTSKDLLLETKYYVALAILYAKDLANAISAINVQQVLEQAYAAYFVFMFITLPKLLADSAAKITVQQVGYYVGYIGINILICFVPVLDLIQLSKITELFKALKPIMDTVLGVASKLMGKVGKAGLVAIKTAEELFMLLDGFLELLKKGTEEVVAFVKKIFEAIKAWVEDLLGITSIESEISRAFINGWSKEKILALPKGFRPKPVDCFSRKYINKVLTKFDEGSIRFCSRNSFKKYGTLGPDGGFVMPKAEFYKLLETSNGDLRIIETKLGLDPGYLGDTDTMIVFIEKKNAVNLRLPSGNETGANPHWIPGGYTSGYIPEAVMDFSTKPNFKEIKLN